MIDLPNITRAAGLSAEDGETLGELIEVSQAVAQRNLTLDAYYESEQVTPDIGIDNIPACVDPGVRCDWARKAVTSVSERVRMDGFVFEGDYEDEAFAAIVRANSLDAEFNRNVASELTHGCMFATVNRSARGVAIRMHTAEDSAAIWDVADQRIGAGMVVADARRTDWGGLRPVPTQVNLHLPGRVVVLRRTGPSSWAAETLPHPLDRPLMEAFTYRATGLKPFGQTRITRTVRYLVDEVERTLRYMAVSSAFYATPQRYIMGLTDEQYDAMVDDKWKTLIGSILLATRDEDGNVPTPGQFSAASPLPYVEAIQTYAKLFSGATGVPLNSLGIVQDNPSSAEAIAAQREDICTAAEDCIESNRESMRNVALMAMAVDAVAGVHRRRHDEDRGGAHRLQRDERVPVRHGIRRLRGGEHPHAARQQREQPRPARPHDGRHAGGGVGGRVVGDAGRLEVQATGALGLRPLLRRVRQVRHPARRGVRAHRHVPGVPQP